MGVSNLVRVGCLGLAVLATSCTYHVPFKLPNERNFEATRYELPLGKIGFARNALDRIIASELLDPKYEKDLEGITFKASYYDPLRQGTYNDGVITFHFGLPADWWEFVLREALVETGFHELAHHYWNKNLTREKRDEFVRIVFDYLEKYKQLKKSLGEGKTKDINDEVYTRFGFTEKSYANFERMLNYRNYPNYYFVSDNDFFGTEAFALLADRQLFSKYTALRLTKRNMSSTLPEENIRLLGLKPFIEEATGELSSLNHIPQELSPFFRGFIHPKYFSTK